jgi:hypothetical protein
MVPPIQRDQVSLVLNHRIERDPPLSRRCPSDDTVIIRAGNEECRHLDRLIHFLKTDTC